MDAAIDTAHAYLSAGAGGAWFDVIPLSGCRVALVVGDIEGLGVRTAAAMGELRAASSALSGLDLLPDEILERLHMMADDPDRHPKPDDAQDAEPAAAGAAAVRETCLYAVYDPATRSCAVASAGHSPPLVAFPDGRVEELDVPQGPALGQGEAQYTAAEHVLPAGAVLLLHNNVAVHSGQNAAASPYEVLARGSAMPGASLQLECDAFSAAAASNQPERDVIALVARTRVLDSSQTRVWTLPADAGAAGRARKLAAAQLAAWGIEELSDTTELIVSELVTNAVRHGEGQVGLRLIRDRMLICEVTDESDTAPRLRRARDDDEGGRGLFITEQLTRRWGARPNRRGKTIWTEQSFLEPLAGDDAVIGS